MSISSYGVTLWNGLEEELKESKNIIKFKNRLKQSILNRYRDEAEGEMI